jgi:hypothetical protein
MDAARFRTATIVRGGGVFLVAVAFAVFASSALAAGTLTVEVVGKGHVTSDDGFIDCTQAGESTCSHDYADEPGECATTPCPPRSALVSLDEAPTNGFSFDSWSGCSFSSATGCSVSMTADKTVTATFTDHEPPSVSLTQPAAGVRAGTIAIAATASDNDAVKQVFFAVGGVSAGTDTSTPYSASFDTHQLPDGSALVTATAEDAAGNATASSRLITVDNTPPDLSLDGPNGQAFRPADTESWSISASDATAGIQSVSCSVAPSDHPPAFAPCSGGNTSESVSGLPEGDYRFTVRAIDKAGNTRDRWSAFSVDATPPQTTITGGPADGSSQTSGSATFTFASDDPGASFQCRVYANGTTAPAFEACTDPAAETVSGLGLGTYRIDVRAVDSPGNADPSPESRTFSVVAPSTPTDPDPTQPTPTLPGPAFAPDTLLDVHPNHKVHRKRAKFVFSSSDPSATFECSLDGAAFAACTSPFKVKVKKGKHTFAVRAVGTSALADQTPASWRWKVKRRHHHRRH